MLDTIGPQSGKNYKKRNSTSGILKPGSREGRLDYKEVCQQAESWIEEILEQLAPDGELRGAEYFMFNPHRADGELNSFKYNISNGGWSDFAAIDHDEKAKGGGILSLVAYYKGISLDDAAALVVRLIADLEKGSNADQQVKTAGRKKMQDTSVQVSPVPATAPHPPEQHRTLGNVTARYCYHDKDGQGLYYQCRFDLRDGKKEFRPQTYRRSEAGACFWAWKGPDGLRTLYNFQELSARLDAPVVVVEGEKAAEAARKLFPDHVAVTSMNGAKAPEKTDWSPLIDRNVLFWPDLDEAGEAYVKAIVKILKRGGSAGTLTVLGLLDVSPVITEGKPGLERGFEPPKGWDCADAFQDGWTAEHVALLGKEFFRDVGVEEIELVGEVGPYSELVIPVSLKDLLMDQFPGGLFYANENFFGYEQGYWRRLEERAEVRNAIARHLGESISEPKNITDPLNLLKDILARTDDSSTPDRNYVCLENGTLDTRTFVLEEHNADHNLRTKIPVSWDPSASCPRWLKFLEEVFVNDADKVEKIQFVQEWIGYCLTPDSSQHKFVWMVGSGGNGKSVLLALLTRLVGVDNVSHSHLERIDRPAVRAELEGKLINISSEMSAEATVADGYFKAIVSGDVVEAERKYKPSYSFRPFVRLIGATNHLPRLLDLSEGFFRRAIVLTFTRQFTEAEQDKDLENKLVAELDGIFVWAVAGLARLRERGSFLIPSSSMAELAIYKEESDPIGMFAEACLVVDETQSMKATDIFRAYLEWCKDLNFKPKNSSGFGRRLGEIGLKKYRAAGGTFWHVREKPDNEYFNTCNYLDVTLHLPAVAATRSSPSMPSTSVRQVSVGSATTV